jgi:hypothetical protein
MRTFVSLALLLLGVLFAAAAMAQDKPYSTSSLAPLDQVKAYAADHDAKVTVRQQDGIWFVEADGLDAFGEGKTIDEAAEDFLHCADMMDHEPVNPANSGSPDCNASLCS